MATTKGIGRGRPFGQGQRKLSEMAYFDRGGKDKTPTEKKNTNTPKPRREYQQPGEGEGVFGGFK